MTARIDRTALAVAIAIGASACSIAFSSSGPERLTGTTQLTCRESVAPPLIDGALATATLSASIVEYRDDDAESAVAGGIAAAVLAASAIYGLWARDRCSDQHDRLELLVADAGQIGARCGVDRDDAPVCELGGVCEDDVCLVAPRCRAELQRLEVSTPAERAALLEAMPLICRRTAEALDARAR